MTETPAAHLVRLKVTYQRWRLERSATGTGYTAHHRQEQAALNFVYAPTLDELEAALMEQASR